jgi:hypothetical protein
MERQSTSLSPSRKDSDGESVSSERPRKSTKSPQSDRSAKSVQSIVTVQPSRSPQSVQFGPSVQASKSAPTGRSRLTRSVRTNRASSHTKTFNCEKCGKVTLFLSSWLTLGTLPSVIHYLLPSCAKSASVWS